MTEDNIQVQELLNRQLIELSKISTLLTEERSARLAIRKKQEIIIANARTIPAGASVLLEGIVNAGFTRMRVFVDAQFSGHSSGLEAKLVYRNSVMEQILVLRASNGSAGAYSESIDISQVPSLQLEISNRDTLNSTVFNAKVVLYSIEE